MGALVKGVLPALITPFDEEGKFDEKRMRNFLRFLVPQVHGLYPCGSYGSGPIMDNSERMRVAEVVMEEVDGRIPVILHTGTPDTKQTIELVKHAEGLGVTAVACLSPYYYLHKHENVIEHFKRIVEAVSTPVFIYHNPKYTNYTSFTPDVLNELAEIGVAGLKDSSANIGFFYDCVAKVKKENFTFLIGSQTVLLPALVGGGSGCVSGLSNLFPRLVNQIFAYADAGEYPKALELQRKANDLRTLTGDGIPIPFYHAALKYRGIDIGYPRCPHLAYSQTRIEGLAEPMRDAIKLEESFM